VVQAVSDDSISQGRNIEVATPDDMPRATVTTKRNQGRSALGRIAEQLPRKLPRVL